MWQKKGIFSTWKFLIQGLWLCYGLPAGYIAISYSILGASGFKDAIFYFYGISEGDILIFSPKTQGGNPPVGSPAVLINGAERG